MFGTRGFYTEICIEVISKLLPLTLSVFDGLLSTPYKTPTAFLWYPLFHWITWLT